jgi:exodeoxyribonuclease VII large subunit
MPQSPSTTNRDIYSVARLNREARLLLEGSFPAIWVEGELSNLSRPASGHVYFSLKDNAAQVRCAFFRQHQRLLRLALKDGLHVLARARVSLYEGRGDFQLIVEYLEEAGEGARQRALEALKQKLAAEGLFDAAHKKPLPRLPRRIGVITSESGAVLHDIVTTLRRRFPAIALLLYPVPVQGEGAAEKIAAAIRLAGARRECDALILARGGGSLEDLWAFNDEVVARAIYACPLPLVSAVGHETDVTLADFVADARAPTPTAAAELLSPNRQEWLLQLTSLEQRCRRLIRARLERAGQQLDLAANRLIHPARQIELLQLRLTAQAHRLIGAQRRGLAARSAHTAGLAARLRDASPLPRLQNANLHVRHLHHRLVQAAQHRLHTPRQRLEGLALALHALSPLATLARGYAIVLDAQTRQVVRDADRVTLGARIETRLAHGRLECVVEKKHAR